MERFWISQGPDLVIAGTRCVPEDHRAEREHFPIEKERLINVTLLPARLAAWKLCLLRSAV